MGNYTEALKNPKMMKLLPSESTNVDLHIDSSEKLQAKRLLLNESRKSEFAQKRVCVNISSFQCYLFDEGCNI